jgi:photosystem II stability/assembly factor-like uncharacterized protein
MKTLYIILVALFLGNNAIAQWEQINPLPGNFNPTSIYFTDASTGYAAGGSGTIIKTTDGGTTWVSLPSVTVNRLYSIRFFNGNVGYAVGDHGTILKTLNAGTSWTALTSGTDLILRSVCFTDDYTGYVVGDSSCVLKTVNGGASWENLNPFSIEADLYSVDFANAGRGIVAGIGSGFMGIALETTDGGISWASLSALSGPLHSVTYSDTNTCFAVGGNVWYRPTFSDILEITDEGRVTDLHRSNNTACLQSVCFPDANTGYAVGDFSTILKTTDGGGDWTVQDPGVSLNLVSVSFPDVNTGYAIDALGAILKTSNGGNPLGIINPVAVSNPLIIYPNPSSGNITIKTSERNSIVELTVWSLNGQELINRQITEPLTQLNVSSLPAGVYEVKIVGENDVQIGKFIKQ